jgi:selenocysteine lyase/cysteine desulfurase
MTPAGEPLASLRAAFPVCARVAYLNAGTNGPVAAASGDAARAELAVDVDAGRAGMPYFERLRDLMESLRAGYAARLGADPADVALTTSTTDGVGRALLALDLRPGDEAITSDEEHPGLLGPLAALRARGVRVRAVPLADVADAVGPATRVVACSHVSWRSGALAPAALAQVDVPVLLDGAQGVGAVPVDVRALGADFYAGPGQKWLCGPTGLGMLYVSPAMRARCAPPAPGYLSLDDPNLGLDARPHAEARAYDTPALGSAAIAYALAALEVLGAPGWDAVHERAASLAERAAGALRERGRQVLARDRTTLVSWEEPGAPERSEELARQGVIVRPIPGGDLLRASFGGWSDERDLERLLAALPA